ncbi:YdcH family protein [Azospirillum sp. SYSU D00513]|uniref:YdcH family protein n=1 Tax=Azospirillum sp. SYSU D00513 TaxID=2812561 RepID=UPI001A96C90C|nr:YdcH family protein [Azospirillum sp. SYSU D00513]
MHSDARLSSLQQKHLRLDQAIIEESKRSWPNEGALKRMKLEKLHVKEEIDRLSQSSSSRTH